jgi:hypothetical protein
MRIGSLALRAAKGLARAVLVCMPPSVQVRARRAWTRLKEASGRTSEPQLPELTQAATEVWQDLMHACAIAGREPIGGVRASARPEGRRADPA